MYFPEQLAPGKILARLPLTPSTLDHLKGITESGIVVTGFAETAISPSKKQRQFYFDMMTDKDGQLQAKVPVAIEIVKLPEDDELATKLKLEVGQFWGIDSLSAVDFGIDLNEDGKAGYWYFVIEPKRLVYRFKKEDFEEISKNYELEDIYIQDIDEKMQNELNNTSKELAGRTEQMPQVNLKSPILNIGNKISTL